MVSTEKSAEHFSAFTSSFDWAVAPPRRAPKALVGSLSASVVLHIALLLAALGWSYFYAQPNQEPASDLDSTLDLTLVPEVTPEPQAQPVEPEPQPLTPEPLVSEPLVSAAPISEASVSESSIAEAVSAEVIVADTPATRSSDPAVRLNLKRPNEWESLALDPPEQQGALVFKRSTREALAKRRDEQDAAQALTRSQIARLGLPADQFRRLVDAGEEVKTAKGCFTKRTENSLNGRQERWWRTACKDSRKPSWRREVLSFGPDHRVDSAADGKSDCPEGQCWAY